MKLKNKTLISAPFWKSFNVLMGVKDLPSLDKLRLARLKRDMAQEIEVLRDTCAGMDMNGDDAEKVMNEFSHFNYENFLAVESLADHLTADDIYNLETLFTQEELA